MRSCAPPAVRPVDGKALHGVAHGARGPRCGRGGVPAWTGGRRMSATGRASSSGEQNRTASPKQVRDLEPGTALWPASRGSRVTAIDSSSVALSTAHRLAAARRVVVECVEADLETWPASPARSRPEARRSHRSRRVDPHRGLRRTSRTPRCVRVRGHRVGPLAGGRGGARRTRRSDRRDRSRRAAGDRRPRPSEPAEADARGAGALERHVTPCRRARPTEAAPIPVARRPPRRRRRNGGAPTSASRRRG